MTRIPLPHALGLGAMCSAVTFAAINVAQAMDRPSKTPLCEPRAFSSKVERVVDGDTMVLHVALGLDVYRRVTVRLRDIDTPEPRGVQRPAGLRAKAFAQDWLLRYGNTVILHEDGLGKYGRVLARLCPSEGGECLSEALVKAGHVK